MPWKARGYVGPKPVSVKAQQAFLDLAQRLMRDFLSDHPEARDQFFRWLERGVAFLERCPKCVRAGEAGVVAISQQYPIVHLPDTTSVNDSDRIAFYCLCPVHLGQMARGTDKGAIEASVRWWATLDGNTRPGRVVVIPSKDTGWSA